MSDPTTTGFAKLVPGFDFLQTLAKSAGAAVPGIGQWVAPTLDPAELEKRIDELKTVQFWLEQNAKMLATTIQALEVQRMTLSTLKTMNVQLGDLRESLTARVASNRAGAKETAPKEAAAKAPALVDPMQWWNALTGQFAELATASLKETAAGAAKAIAGNVVRQSVGAAKGTIGKAMSRTQPKRADDDDATAPSDGAPKRRRRAPATRRTP